MHSTTSSVNLDDHFLLAANRDPFSTGLAFVADSSFALMQAMVNIMHILAALDAVWDAFLDALFTLAYYELWVRTIYYFRCSMSLILLRLSQMLTR